MKEGVTSGRGYKLLEMIDTIINTEDARERTFLFSLMPLVRYEVRLNMKDIKIMPQPVRRGVK